MVQLPVPVSVTVLPDTVQGPAASKLTVRPDDAVALTANGASPKVLLANAPNVMVWFAGLEAMNDAIPELFAGSRSVAELLAVAVFSIIIPCVTFELTMATSVNTADAPLASVGVMQ